ncbi:hypothetical protein ACWD4G_42555 [Streptomyces sp. NPDC002643]
MTRLRPRQQMGMDCALCGRPLGMHGRVLGEAKHLGFSFQLWTCAPACLPFPGLAQRSTLPSVSGGT